MLRRMAMTNDNLPWAPVDRDHIARLQAFVNIRQGRYRLALAGTALFKFGQAFSVQPVLAELFGHEAGAMSCDLVPDGMGRQKFARRHIQGGPCFFHQPSIEALATLFLSV